MPWTVDDPPNPAIDKSKPKRRACVSAANEALERGDSESEAIQACIGAMNNATSTKDVNVSKSSDELQIVWGEVYAPGHPDAHGHYMTSDEIRKMAHAFIAEGKTSAIDVGHDQDESHGAYVVESFIARDGDPDFIPGAWVMGVKIADENLWKQVKDGEINGFSYEAMGKLRPGQLDIQVQPLVVGKTVTDEDHSHTFYVHFDEGGNFIGGVTDQGPDGHVHTISQSTVTDPAGDGHRHRFSYVESVIHGN